MKINFWASVDKEGGVRNGHFEGEFASMFFILLFLFFLFSCISFRNVSLHQLLQDGKTNVLVGPAVQRPARAQST